MGTHNGFPSHSYGTSLAIWDHTVYGAVYEKIPITYIRFIKR